MFAALTNKIVTGQDDELIRRILQTLIQKTLAPVNIDYSNSSYVANMLDIFQTLLVDLSFAQRSLLVKSMQKFAYSLVEESRCNSSAITYSKPQYYLQTAKLSFDALAGRRFFSANGSDYVQFPNVSSTQVSALYLDNASFNPPYVATGNVLQCDLH